MQFQFLRELPDPLEQFLYFLIVLAGLGIAFFVIGEAIPRRVYRYDKPPFTCFQWEKGGAVYTKLGIQKWKNHMPDITRVLKIMVGKRIDSPRDPDHLERLILELCNGEFIHAVQVLSGPVFLLFLDRPYGIAAAILFSVGNIPFVLIQRYNRPRVAALRERLLRSARAKNPGGDSP